MSTSVLRTARRFLKDQAGSNALEYGLIVALVSLAVVAGASTAGVQMGILFTDIGTGITNAIQTAGANL